MDIGIVSKRWAVVGAVLLAVAAAACGTDAGNHVSVDQLSQDQSGIQDTESVESTEPSERHTPPELPKAEDITPYPQIRPIASEEAPVETEVTPASSKLRTVFSLRAEPSALVRVTSRKLSEAEISRYQREMESRADSVLADADGWPSGVSAAIIDRRPSYLQIYFVTENGALVNLISQSKLAWQELRTWAKNIAARISENA